jgi:hypothetical protein
MYSAEVNCLLEEKPAYLMAVGAPARLRKSYPQKLE